MKKSTPAKSILDCIWAHACELVPGLLRVHDLKFILLFTRQLCDKPAESKTMIVHPKTQVDKAYPSTGTGRSNLRTADRISQNLSGCVPELSAWGGKRLLNGMFLRFNRDCFHQTEWRLRFHKPSSIPFLISSGNLAHKKEGEWSWK